MLANDIDYYINKQSSSGYHLFTKDDYYEFYRNREKIENYLLTESMLSRTPE